MKNRLLASCVLMLCSIVSFAQEDERVQMEQYVEKGIDFVSVSIGIVIGIIVGFSVVYFAKKKPRTGV